MIATLTMAVAALLAILLAAPETAWARLLHAAIIAPLATRLARVRRGDVVLVLAVAACIWLVGREGLQLAAMAAPDVAAWAAMVDLGALIDIGIAAVIAITTTPLRAWAKAARPSRLARPRSRHTRPPRTEAANDEEGEDQRRAA